MPENTKRTNLSVRAWVLVALALPWLAIAGSIAKAHVEAASGVLHTFEIGGFDPRDPLRGHYLRYRLLVGDDPAITACAEDPGCRVCLVRDGGRSHARVLVPGERCRQPIAADVLRGGRRYLLSETLARPAERLLADAAREGRATADLRLLPDGELRAEGIRVDGEPIEEAAERLRLTGS